MAVIRERLLDQLIDARDARIRLVVGAPGSGKTTVLRELAHHDQTTNGVRPAWYSAAAHDGHTSGFVNKLAVAFGIPLGRHATRITHLDTLLRRLGAAGTDLTVYLDNVHRLAGRPAADALGTLLNDAPANLRFVIATQSERTPELTEIVGSAAAYRIDDPGSRFRAAEVERLFRETYRQPLPPATAAALCVRVEGWPAALHLFHLDTRLRPVAEQLAAADRPLAVSPLLRNYLDTRVLHPLPGEVRDFMIQASALGVLSGSLCDALLHRSGSARLLEWLAEHHTLTIRSGHSAAGFRFHLLLQQHLEDLLAERFGPRRTTAHYRNAAAHLVEFGHWAEAYRAFARAGDWVRTAEILHSSRTDQAGLFRSAATPAALFESDPWVALATARRLRGEGRMVDACESYAVAERGFDDPRMRRRCAVERSDVAVWAPPAAGVPVPVDSTTGVARHLREAIRGHPARLLARAVPNSDPSWTLAKALAAAIDGQVELAHALLHRISTSEDPFISVSAGVAVAIIDATSMRAHGTVDRFRSLAAQAERSGWLWQARLAKAACALIEPDYRTVAIAVRDECLALGDHWGAMVASFCVCVNLVRGKDSEAVPALRRAICESIELGAPIATVWYQLMLVDQLESAGDPAVEQERARLHEWLVSAAVPRAAARGEDFLKGTHSTVEADPDEPRAPEQPPAVLRCLGAYELIVGGAAVDLTSLRRQARTVLHILSVHSGQPVHEERLVGILWPDVPLKQAKRRLQVAVSSIRTALAPALGRRTGGVIVRLGGTYALNLPPGSVIDTATLDELAGKWRTGRRLASADELATLAGRALDLYRGELLSDEGLAEWVLTERERLRTQTSNLAVELAKLEIDRDDPRAAIDACRRGLEVDRQSDQLWRLLTMAHSRDGNLAAALRAERRYQDLISG